MRVGTDIVIFGTGSFAARIVFDLAATARFPVSVTIIGRNPTRLAWLRTAAAARADMFGTGVTVSDRQTDGLSTEAAIQLLAELAPRVVANTASIQGGRVVTDHPDAWVRLARTGGLGITSLLQARISLDLSRAVAQASPSAHFINCCYPDVVNPMIAAAGLPITCGIGNVAILAHAFSGVLGPDHPHLRLLAQHAALAAFRRPAEERHGPAPLRMWLAEEEITDVFDRFTTVKLAEEPVIDISGASGVPLLVALATGGSWRGHAPGPNGLPGGYPLRLEKNRLELDLPARISRAEAVAWNRSFEEKNGVVVGNDGYVTYNGKVQDALRSVSPNVAAGFAIADFEAAYEALLSLRERLRMSDEK